MQLFATYTFGQALADRVGVHAADPLDLARRHRHHRRVPHHDLNGWKKAFWLVLVVLLPLLGVLIYVIACGDEMKAHGVSDNACKKSDRSPSSRT